MAPPQGQLRASRYFLALFVIIASLWGLVIWQGTHTPKLGLDLQGGTSMTLSATVNGKPDPQKLDEARQIIENRVNDTGVTEAEVTTEGDRNIVVNVPGNNREDLKKIGAPAELRFREVLNQTENVPADAASPSPSPSASGSPSGSPSAAASPTASGSASPKPTGSASPTGSGSPSGSASATPPPPPSDQELLKKVYAKVGGGDAKKGEALIGQIAQIQDPKEIANNPQAMQFLAPFRKLSPEEVAVLPADVQFKAPTISCEQLNGRPPGSVVDPKAQVTACDQEGQTKYLMDKARVLGTDVSNANFSFDPNQSQWVVDLSFTSEGQDKWTKLTADTVQRQVAVVLDNEVVSAPTIQERIAGNAQITGAFSRQEAQALSAQLKYGALPMTFKIENTYQVTPTLGLDQLKAGLLAGMIGIGLVVVYCFIYYRLLGFVVISSLLVSASIVYPLVVLLGNSIGLALTLSGIAGFIVAIGITADSFVVFFERLKDEVKEGRTVRSAVPRAWIRARRTILSANTVSIMAAAVLYILAIGAVKGFAFTLGLSTLIDLVIVFLFTHPLVAVLSRIRAFSSPRISGLGNLQPDPKAKPGRVRGAVTKES